jgi:hypothetical protein
LSILGTGLAGAVDEELSSQTAEALGSGGVEGGVAGALDALTCRGGRKAGVACALLLTDTVLTVCLA